MSDDSVSIAGGAASTMDLLSHRAELQREVRLQTLAYAEIDLDGPVAEPCLADRDCVSARGQREASCIRRSADVVTSRLTLVVLLRICTVAPANGSILRIADHTDNRALLELGKRGQQNGQTRYEDASDHRRHVRSPPCNELAVSGLDRLAIAELDLDHLFAGRNTRGDLFRVGIIDNSAIRVGILAVETEGDPARLRCFCRILEDGQISDMFRRKTGDIEDVNVAIDSIDEPDLLLIRPQIDAVAHRAVRLSSREDSAFARDVTPAYSIPRGAALCRRIRSRVRPSAISNPSNQSTLA